MFDIQLLEPCEAGKYERFTFSRERAGLSEKCLDQRAVVLAASWLSEPVGLIIARVIPETQKGVIYSLFVGEGLRSSGLGTRLLLAAGERLKEKGCQSASISFSASRKDTPAWRRVLQKCGWDEPTKSHEIAKYKAESFLWVNRVGLHGAGRAIPWDEPAPEILEEVKKGEDIWYPRRVSPFNKTVGGRPDPATSFWFCAGGKIAGWLVTSRVADDTLNYDTFYVREEAQGTGLAMPLLAKTITTQLDLGIPYWCYTIVYRPDSSNSHLLRFHEKHFKPLNVALSEYHLAMKTL
jgi:GNAT superfamily N-acetyltransferase